MLRRASYKLIQPKVFSFVPLPRFRFSETPNPDPKDPKNKDKKNPTWTERITKLNAFFEIKEKALASYFKNIKYRHVHLSNNRLLVLLATMLILGYQIKTLLYQNIQEISYNVIFNPESIFSISFWSF